MLGSSALNPPIVSESRSSPGDAFNKSPLNTDLHKRLPILRVAHRIPLQSSVNGHISADKSIEIKESVSERIMNRFFTYSLVLVHRFAHIRSWPTRAKVTKQPPLDQAKKQNCRQCSNWKQTAIARFISCIYKQPKTFAKQGEQSPANGFCQDFGMLSGKPRLHRSEKPIFCVPKLLWRRNCEGTSVILAPARL